MIIGMEIEELIMVDTNIWKEDGFLDRQESWLKRRLNATTFERPQLPVIPLGVHPEEWKAPYNNLELSRKDSRKKLGIDQNALIVLIAGRMDILTKNHPSQGFRILEELSEKFPNLELIIYGETPNTGQKLLWERGTKVSCPNLKIHWIPGRKKELSVLVRWAADVFLSLVDNPQETFGITPLEAMAAGIPCVVSDWDGYKDTVIQPEESTKPCGFRIPTQIISGIGEPQAINLLQECIDYDQAVGQISQGIAFDIEIFRQKMIEILSDSNLREVMGKNGQERVANKFSWKQIIQTWRGLLNELNSRRKIGVDKKIALEPSFPSWLPSTYEGFGVFATERLIANNELEWNNELKGIDHVQRLNIIHARLSEPFEAWSVDGFGTSIDQININPNELTPRVKGWLMKQGWLAKKS